MKKCLIILPFILIGCVATFCGCAKDRTSATAAERISALDQNVQTTPDAPDEDCKDGDCDDKDNENDDCKDGDCKRILPRKGFKKEKALLDGEADDDEFLPKLPNGFSVKFDFIFFPHPPRNRLPIEPNGEKQENFNLLNAR